jgi:hypothetical protein
MTVGNQIRPLGKTDQRSFQEICDDARSGLSDAIDLILVHNEKEVRGDQPRSTLNPLIVLLAVASWERYVGDLRALSVGTYEGTGVAKNQNGGAYLLDGTRGEGPGPAARLHHDLTAGRLPSAWNVLTFTSWSGRYAQAPVAVTGQEVGEQVDRSIRLRNQIAHRMLPSDVQGDEDPWYKSDAESNTVQAGLARGVTAILVQVVSQSMTVIADVAGYGKDFRLPEEWFEPTPRRLRGVNAPGSLWFSPARRWRLYREPT